MLGRPRRLAILAEACFTRLAAKTAVGVLRYRPEEAAAVIDSTRAGTTAADCIGAGGAVPVVADLEAAAARGADSLLIGIAPQGGELPAAWRAAVRAALERGWDVIAGLHAFLADDPEFAPLAARHGGRILDLRRPPAERPIATARAAALDALVVLTVGTDCNVGKMTAAIEIQRALRARGVAAAFVATGQTGMLIADRGVAVDALVADFVAGVMERLVCEAAADADVVLVEGQGSLHHPGYAGVTLAMLHGACPAAMILCHEAGRTRIRARTDPASGPAIPPLAEVARAYETAAAWVHPSRVVGAALNTSEIGPEAAHAALERASAELGLPVADPVRNAAPLAETILGLHAGRAAARAAARGRRTEAS